MSRKARERALSGIYHILIAGNDKLLFVEDADRRRFLSLLAAAKERDFAELYAYCLLDERVHLVIKEGLTDVSRTVRDVLAAYALWYNEKYDREGKLFYDRFKSEPLESDEDMLGAVRFVHRRAEAGAGELITSYECYLKRNGADGGAADTEPVLFLLGSAADFKLFSSEPDERDFLSGEKKAPLSDEELVRQIRILFDGVEADELDGLSDRQYMILLKRIRGIEGASIRQIARVLGISKSTVERAK